MPLIILVPMILSPLPMGLLSLCSSGDMFSEQPRGLHWAQFLSSFLFTGCFAIPLLLALTHTIEWGAAVTQLAGTLILCAILGVNAYLKSKDDDVKLSGF